MARVLERLNDSPGVHHTTIINWVKQVGEKLPPAPPVDKIPTVGELDELETFVGSRHFAQRGEPPHASGSKKTKFGYGRRPYHLSEGILAWVIGDHSAETFKPLWDIVRLWQCYFYVTDGWPVYASFIEERRPYYL